MSQHASPRFRWLGRQPYEPVWRNMQTFTDQRNDETEDEFWLLEHEPVFTLGLNGSIEHVLAPGDIPVVSIDRGGEVTYHGPGQLVVYPLVDLKRLGFGARDLVCAIETAIIRTVAQWGITAEGRSDARGVYVDERKLASIGLRIRRGCSYHGLAFNVSMDLEPFSRINPCGYTGLKMTRLADLGGPVDVKVVGEAMKPYLLEAFGYNVEPAEREGTA